MQNNAIEPSDNSLLRSLLNSSFTYQTLDYVPILEYNIRILYSTYEQVQRLDLMDLTKTFKKLLSVCYYQQYLDIAHKFLLS